MRNPVQAFTIKSITRADIAEDVNCWFKLHGHPNQLAPDDERLTDELCQSYANALKMTDEYDDGLDIDQTEHVQQEAAIYDLAKKVLGEEFIESLPLALKATELTPIVKL